MSSLFTPVHMTAPKPELGKSVFLWLHYWKRENGIAPTLSSVFQQCRISSLSHALVPSLWSPTALSWVITTLCSHGREHKVKGSLKSHVYTHNSSSPDVCPLKVASRLLRCCTKAATEPKPWHMPSLAPALLATLSSGMQWNGALEIKSVLKKWLQPKVGTT